MNKKIRNAIGLLLLMVCACLACNDEVLLLEEAEAVENEVISDVGAAEADADDGEEAFRETVIYVHICGAVNTPGVYQLPAGSRIYDGVNEAGGFDAEADQEAVNLVEELKDGEQLRIPFIGECVSGPDSGLIDINQADVATLCQIPGIGENRAQSIVDYRQENGSFGSVEELMQVPGIKEGIYSNIYPYIECK